MTVSFTELRAKEVIRLCDAESIGCVSDLLFEKERGCIRALCVVPTRGWSALLSSEHAVIPWEKVRCIGRDTILVDLCPEECACVRDVGRKRFFHRS